MSRSSLRISAPHLSRGLSLIEIMVSLAIAALLLLGLSQIFIGSKSAYLVQDGMSRSQENARFVLNEFEKYIRMVDYAGCGNKVDPAMQFLNHTIPWGTTPVTSRLAFNRPLEGFDYTGCTSTSCATDNSDVSAGAATEWKPTLPNAAGDIGTYLPVKGSDILIVRVLSGESTPTLGEFNPTTGAFVVAAISGNPDFVKPGDLYGITSCRPRMDIFKASAGSGAAVAGGLAMIAACCADNPLRQLVGDTTTTWGWNQAQSDFKQPPAGTPGDTLNAEVHRAEYLAFFVGLSGPAGDQRPVLKMAHFVGGTLQADELADGVEAMQITYGIDTNGDGVPDGPFQQADAVAALNGATSESQIDANWQHVVSVRVALLIRGETIGGTPPRNGGNTFIVNGAQMKRPSDARFRDIYTTTIAVRNRLVLF